MRLGIGSFTYPWAIGFPDAVPSNPLTPLGLLDKAEELGVGLVQFGPNMPLDKLPEIELREVIKCANRRKIRLEIGMEGLDEARLRHQIQFAKRIGVSVLQTTVRRAGGKNPLPSQALDSLHAVADQLAREEIRLAIDNCEVAAPELNELLGSVSSPWVGAALDTLTPMAFPQDWQISVRLLGHRTLCLHIKDYVVEPGDYGMGFSVKGCPVGEGQLSVPWMVNSFASLRTNPSAILESWTPHQKTLRETIELEDTWVRGGVDYLRRFISD